MRPARLPNHPAGPRNTSFLPSTNASSRRRAVTKSTTESSFAYRPARNPTETVTRSSWRCLRRTSPMISTWRSTCRRASRRPANTRVTQVSIRTLASADGWPADRAVGLRDREHGVAWRRREESRRLARERSEFPPSSRHFDLDAEVDRSLLTEVMQHLPNRQ
jgi:hypothetical protein